MANHHKPTKEEMKREMDKSLADLDKLPPEGDTPPADPPQDPPTPPAGDPPTPPAKPPIDYKAKFEASSREAQVIGFKNKEVNKAIEEAGALPEPTEDEMKALHGNWDELDSTMKGLLKDNLLSKRKFELIHTATSKFKEVDQWNEKVDTYVQDPATLANHPELEGKQEEFKAFASKPTRRGVDFDDLVLAFQGEQAKTKLPPKKGQMFEQGSGGPATPPAPKDDKLSPAEGEALRKSDYKKFVQLLKAGKIRNE